MQAAEARKAVDCAGFRGTFRESDDFARFSPGSPTADGSDATETSEPHRCSRRGIAGGLTHPPSASISMHATTGDGVVGVSTARASPECTSTVVMLPLACPTYLPRRVASCQRARRTPSAHRTGTALPPPGYLLGRHPSAAEASGSGARAAYRRNVGLGCGRPGSPVW